MDEYGVAAAILPLAMAFCRVSIRFFFNNEAKLLVYVTIGEIKKSQLKTVFLKINILDLVYFGKLLISLF